ncbi:MAG: FUSC family protein [Steroidobacteraceae bacterium]
MPTAVTSLRQNMVAALLRTKPAQLPWRVLVRNTAAVVLPLVWGIATAHLLPGIAATVGAVVTMYSDQPGPYRQRLLRLLAVSAAGGLATFLGLTLNPHLPALLVASFVIAFCGALLVVFGDAIARVGMTAMILLVIATDLPAPSLGATLALTGWVTAGGVLLTLFSIAAWPLQRYGPEREALAAVYRELAAMARRGMHDGGAALELTTGMTELQHTLLGPLRAHGAVMDHFGVMLELAERARLELTALEVTDPGERLTLLVQQDCAALLEAISAAIEAGADPRQRMRTELDRLQRAERAAAEHEAELPEGPWRHVQALCGQLSAAVRNAERAGTHALDHPVEEDLQRPHALRPQSPLAILGANLTPRSAAFRHAVRSAVCFTFALWLARMLPVEHGYWIPMTVAIVLRADFAATFSYGLLRVVGTILGLLLTTALVYLLPLNAWVHLGVLAVLCAGYRYFGNVHYGIAVACLTGMVVLLLAFAGERPEPTVVARLIDTIIGSAVSLSVYALWPTWEKGRAREMLAEMLRAYATYLKSLAGGTVHERRDGRQGARVARVNAEASVNRLLAEPATPPALAELAQSLLTNGNRLARTIMTLEALLGHTRSVPQQVALEPFLHQSASALAEVAEALSVRREPKALPPIRAAQRRLERELAAATDIVIACDRLVDNINTLAYLTARAPEQPPLMQPL